VERLPLDRVGVPHLHQRAGVEDVDAVGDGERNPEVVRDHDEAHSPGVLHRLQKLQDLGLGRHVEGGRRLVGDQELRISCERRRQSDALPHPT
jgi:hypothetical protein